jgi:hypothetical protein
MRNRFIPLSIARLVGGAAALALAGSAWASPMAYVATVVTDVQVGTQTFHNALLKIKFIGDTNDISPALDGSGNPILSTECAATTTDNSKGTYTGDGSNYFFYLAKGVAGASITSKGKTIRAQLNSGQLLVTLDSCNGGIGFGMLTGPTSFEVAYPVAFTLGTAMAVSTQNSDAGGDAALRSPANMSGNAYSCPGYPPSDIGQLTGAGCGAPLAIKSDMGDILVYQPYTDSSCPDCNHIGALNRGTFRITPIIGRYRPSDDEPSDDD